METFKERLQIERMDLREKLTKLSSFITTERFKQIDDVQQALLKAQEKAMDSYLTCLNERLKRLYD